VFSEEIGQDVGQIWMADFFQVVAESAVRPTRRKETGQIYRSCRTQFLPDCGERGENGCSFS
jgi:hypothetical protein